jgi:predicted nucleotidyltransferase
MELKNLHIPRGKIEDFCRQHNVREFALFGSVLRDDFNHASDVDVLISFAPDTRYSLFDLADMREELKDLFGREVDLVEKEALRNPFRRRHILQNMEVVYAA